MNGLWTRQGCQTLLDASGRLGLRWVREGGRVHYPCFNVEPNKRLNDYTTRE